MQVLCTNFSVNHLTGIFTALTDIYIIIKTGLTTAHDAFYIDATSNNLSSIICAHFVPSNWDARRRGSRTGNVVSQKGNASFSVWAVTFNFTIATVGLIIL